MTALRSWLVLLAAVLAVAVTARLGMWQLDRAAQKTTLQQAHDHLGKLPPLDGAALARDASAVAVQASRKAAVDGVWQPEETVYLDNRVMAGRTGFYVVTPLRLDDGHAVLVQRGWLPRNQADRTQIAPYRTPVGRVRVEGHIAPTLSRLYELGHAASGAIRQNLDLAEHALQTRLALLPLVIVQDDDASQAGDGLLRQWPQPASDVSKNYGYAFQWFSLSLLAATLYVWFQFIRPRRRAHC